MPTPTRDGVTPAHGGCQGWPLDILGRRWAAAGPLDHSNDGGTGTAPLARAPALTKAAVEGYLEAVRLLLDRSADPNQRSDDDGTALMEAAAEGK